MIKKVLNDKLLGKALKTFIEGFIASIIVVLPTTDLSNFYLVKSMMIGAIAMGISAVLNLIQEKLNGKRGT